MSSIITQNRNRAHAVKQLQRGLKRASHTDDHIDDGMGEIQLLGSIANSLIYIGDILKDMNDHFSHPMKEVDPKSALFDRTDPEHEYSFDDDEIPF